MVEDTAAESVSRAVDLAVGAEGTGGDIDGTVPVGLADVGASAGVDLAQGRDGVDGDGVGANAHDWACAVVISRTSDRGRLGERRRVGNLPYVSCSCNWTRCRSPVRVWKYIDQPETLEKNGPGYLASGWSVRRYIETRMTFETVSGLVKQ